MKPLHIFIDNQELIGYTDFTLSRNKEDLTGQFSVTLFMGYTPNEPILQQALAGAEVTIYIGGHLAFCGRVERRKGNTVPGEAQEESSSASVTLDATQYKVQLSGRGKSQQIIKSSHLDTIGTLLEATDRVCLERLTDEFDDIELDWQAAELELGTVRFNDGGMVLDELHRIQELAGLYIYEGRDGRVVVQDGPSDATGEPIVLGTNILSHSAEIKLDQQNSHITVKGQRTKVDVVNAPAILPTFTATVDTGARLFAPLTLHLHGDATEEVLRRRGTFEINKRTTASQEITVDMFYLQQSTGEPWDLGQRHLVVIPPEQINSEMEITSITYTLNATDTIKTTLTLSVPPTPSQQSTPGPLSSLAEPGITLAPNVGPSPEIWQTRQFEYPARVTETQNIPTIGQVLQNTTLGVPLQLPADFVGEDE